VNEKSYLISIIVCTYNRSEILKESLHSLVDQTVDKALYEVIVVNNNSSDSTQDVAEKFSALHTNFRVVIEKQQGLSHARNRGYKEALTHWVAYIDDDARAFNNWVERILYVIRNFDFDCFGGVYLPWYKYGRPKWFLDRYGSNQNKIAAIGELPNDLYMDGGNCVFKKSLLEQFNGFASNLGMTGKKIAYGEETLLQNRIRKENYKIGFDPELLIEHAVVKKKLNVFWFIKSAYANGRDSWDTFEVVPSPPIILNHLFQAVWFFLFMLKANSLKLLKPNYYLQNMIIDSFSPLSYAIGAAVNGTKKRKVK
jgi:glucosyl-dolichyl phosphate glucuronosyltransferase